ncbi:hypothetical protein [Ornithinimicrobium sufpigmenti]|uniref:hypothetical protein n=1 Tax=Ornithinimicrobium sufpigmenti TaxID=2508882 RepID=UPI0010359D46|nr:MULTISPECIES: hypothetical protein [unclassified Ornithinimicrobium]
MSEITAQSELDATPDQKGRCEPRTVVASALALGALTLPDHTRMGSGQRHLLRLARSAYVGWYTADMARGSSVPDVSPVAFGAVSGMAAGLITAPMDEATDRWVADRLRAWGVPRPRLALALIGAGMGALLALDQQRQQASVDEDELLEPDDFFESVDVPDHARALVQAMLDAAGSPAGDAPVPAGLAGTAATLRGQLDHARASVLRDQPLSTDVHFEVPPETPRVVPHTQGWPVRAHFEAGGLPLQVELWIGNGYLSHLSIMLRDDDLAEDDQRWEIDILDVLESWPAPEQVRLVVETPDGSRPVG